MNDKKKYRNINLTKNRQQKENVSIFLRSQDYFLFNLLKKNGRQKQFQPIIKLISNNKNNLPKVLVNKIVRRKSKDGYYSFEKVEPNIKTKKLTIKEPEDLDSYYTPAFDSTILSKYDVAYEKRKKKLYRASSCRLFRNQSNLNFNKNFKNLLVIKHINKIQKIQPLELKNIKPIKRIYSGKIPPAQRNLVFINNNNIFYNNNFNISNINLGNTKNESTQINNRTLGTNSIIGKKYSSRSYKSIKLLINQQRRPFSSSLKQIE